MTRNFDSADPYQYPAAYERRQSVPLTIMDLPTDVVEEIARCAGDSICNFALAHPRFATIVNQMRRPRIKAAHICENLQRAVTRTSRSVRALTLMNCHSESTLMHSLILKCPQLTELNTVNSSLETSHLVESIQFLSKLETLSCTIGEPDDPLAVSFPDHGSLKSVYVEHGPEAIIFVLNLINSCLKIERVHLVEALYPFPYGMLWSHILMVDFGPLGFPSISRERWQTLHTVIFTTLASSHEQRYILSVFENRPASLDVTVKDLCLQTDIVYDRGEFNVMTARQQIADYESDPLIRMYVVRSEDRVMLYGQNRQLRFQNPLTWSLSSSLPESIASLTTLVELDLSQCHADHRPEVWYSLFQSSAGLESLRVPLCFLAIRSSDAARNNVFPFVEVLEKLRLKRLHCSRVDCVRWRGCLDDPVLPPLTGLTHLEELTLMNPPISRYFLNRIAIRSLSCLRIHKRDTGHFAIRSMSCLKIRQRDTGYLNLTKLKIFLATCENLRYLKVDLDLLPLHEKLFWRRLSRANLKQLCIRSSSTKRVDLRIVLKFLPGICQGLDVLHIHAPELENASELSSVLKEEIGKMNLSREHNPIQSVLPTALDQHQYPGRDIIPNFPGRALCCIRDEWRQELIGWDND